MTDGLLEAVLVGKLPKAYVVVWSQRVLGLGGRHSCGVGSQPARGGCLLSSAFTHTISDTSGHVFLLMPCWFRACSPFLADGTRVLLPNS